MCDEINMYNITWSEFVNENLVVRYMSGYLTENSFNVMNNLYLSEYSNCSFPTLIKTNNVLWNMWIQMDKIYSSYSLDYGKTWSNPKEDYKSTQENIIRYKFVTNNKEDIKKYRLDAAFGTYCCGISFVGFTDIHEKKDGF
ncbi:hypothetical protein JWYL7_1273 [Alkalithermobacter thermoalcaliphilus JW-YL-7 = DSM 7308]|uniref:Uncharacterized protein n=1 Tax=Alkalithermobacter thermoalcaliphilus JW-YL-7 = DSM 7308 TaxID=1121328 RepID=A0A150FRJ2_CLOPD|nr:hypothetical protein JWYL7_1273 [[Clostridium] paradoxum JW-YL-7 = DSM 7308]